MEETRVERFKEYRKEIAMMEDESTFSNKEKVARKVDALKSSNNGKETTSLDFSYDDVVNTSDIYSENIETRTNPLTKKTKKDTITRVCIIAAITIIVIALVICGILYFGGKA